MIARRQFNNRPAQNASSSFLFFLNITYSRALFYPFIPTYNKTHRNSILYRAHHQHSQLFRSKALSCILACKQERIRFYINLSFSCSSVAITNRGTGGTTSLMGEVCCYFPQQAIEAKGGKVLSHHSLLC